MKQLSIHWNNWANDLDPYGMQRLLFYKCCYIASLLMIVNIIYKPDVFSAYFWPPLMMFLTYESPLVIRNKDRLHGLIIVYVTCLIGSVSFYLLFSYKIIFSIYALLFYFIYFYLSSRYWKDITNAIFSICFVSSSIMVVKPELSLQVALDIFMSIILSLVVVIIGIKTFPNYYISIWKRAFRLFILEIVKEIDGNFSNEVNVLIYKNIVSHLNLTRLVRHRIAKRHLRSSVYCTVYIRNMHIALQYVAFEQVEISFWHYIRNNLDGFQKSIATNCTYQMTTDYYNANITHEHQIIINDLVKSIRFWNKLCLIK